MKSLAAAILFVVFANGPAVVQTCEAGCEETHNELTQICAGQDPMLPCQILAEVRRKQCKDKCAPKPATGPSHGEPYKVKGIKDSTDLSSKCSEAPDLPKCKEH